MISANSRLPSAFSASLSARKARSTRKNWKLTNWRAAGVSVGAAVWGWASLATVMISEFYQRVARYHHARESAGYQLAVARLGAVVSAAPDQALAAWRLRPTSEGRRQDHGRRSPAGIAAAAGGRPQAHPLAADRGPPSAAFG